MEYITYDQLAITVMVIAGVLAFIVLVGNAVKTMHEWRVQARKPVDGTLADHEQRITHLEECCTEVRGKLQSDWQFQQDEKEFNLIMLEAVGQLMKHALDGNDTDGLKAADEKIDKYLREKSQR